MPFDGWTATGGGLPLGLAPDGASPRSAHSRTRTGITIALSPSNWSRRWRLRKKVEGDPARPRLLVTEPGVGYRLRDRLEP